MKRRRLDLATTVGWALATGACAGTIQTGPPLPNPEALAVRAQAEGGAEGPARIRFEWEYGDRKGTLRGDGVGRVNPPDSFRLDFFTAGEGSMAAALVEGELTTLGQIEQVELPDPVFLYAMAGLFRPGAETPERGFAADGTEVLVYGQDPGPTRYFFFRGDRLERLEERQGSRVARRIRLQWDPEVEWPRQADYRDHVTPSRARWELIEVREAPGPYDREIYELETTR